MSQALLEIRPFPKPSSLFSYTLSDSQRTTTETSTIWGPGTLSGRAILALGEVTLRGINQLGIRRRLATIRLRAPSLNKAMCDDLLEFSRPALYSAWIGKEALRLILTQICVESKYSMLVLALCEWPQDEARLIVLEIMQSLARLLHPSKRQLEEIYNFLVAIIQVKEQWRHIVGEAAQLLHSTLHDQQVLFNHPIRALCTEISTPSTPLSTLQKAYSANMRAEMWLSLQNCGLPLSEKS